MGKRQEDGGGFESACEGHVTTATGVPDDASYFSRSLSPESGDKEFSLESGKGRAALNL